MGGSPGLGLYIFGALISAGFCLELNFPTGFKFGVATASYQIEGAWNESDKGVSIWDTYTHERSIKIADKSSGDIACDSYHFWRRDIEMLTELGVDFYRFSISWTRLMPSGYPNHISEDGKKYYNDIINTLLENGIEPIVTLYHWDLPQALQNLGGWTNPYVSDWFEEYAREVFSLFANRVKIWVTINEPIVICDGAYSTGILAPGTVIQDNIGSYMCNKHVLIAHAKAYRVYDKEFRPKYNGKISITNHIIWMEPHSEDHTHIAEIARQNFVGRYSHPIFSKEGGWPPEIERIIAENSKKMGYHTSRLPAFTKEEIELVKGTYDFYGLNHYTSRKVRKTKPNEYVPSNIFGGEPEFQYIGELDPVWPVSCNGWLASHPVGLRRLLSWLKKEYGDIKFFITENGYPTGPKNYIEDDDRIQYYKDYLEQIMLAINEDGVDVIGYAAWSLVDNFEWMDGYNVRFGLYEVNFTDPQRTRTPRKSAKFYSEIISNQKKLEAKKYRSSQLYILCSFIILLILFAIVVVSVCVYWKAKVEREKMRCNEIEVNSELLVKESQY